MDHYNFTKKLFFAHGRESSDLSRSESMFYVLEGLWGGKCVCVWGGGVA